MLCITNRRNFVHITGVAASGSGLTRALMGCTCALSPPWLTCGQGKAVSCGSGFGWLPQGDGQLAHHCRPRSSEMRATVHGYEEFRRKPCNCAIDGDVIRRRLPPFPGGVDVASVVDGGCHFPSSRRHRHKHTCPYPHSTCPCVDALQSLSCYRSSYPPIPCFMYTPLATRCSITTP